MTTVKELDALDRAGLATLWAELLGGSVPPGMSQLMQRRYLAFALQARKGGDLAPALAARLDRLAAGEVQKAALSLKPGARLLRAWNGTTHVVDVVADGFLWNGTCHRSLSAIARAITGARWSGPRFFGLIDAAEATTKAGQVVVPRRKAGSK
ncbi:DUF2924 domain-containing protein [Neogemmobacter tilapiae]|uniref:DUF2924 domain-containing protein n=1 Tax=Neogemmobacter tilapiae TaxID=875041 RepID=A0A918TRU6_9RHOB|nr:DUF2924 domain-containing protein [Gemmobacter tilapiae]GHC60625.1 hypothetical protein GCM10007315_25620 [Gemmobacter tilapiae]